MELFHGLGENEISLYLSSSLGSREIVFGYAESDPNAPYLRMSRDDLTQNPLDCIHGDHSFQCRGVVDDDSERTREKVSVSYAEGNAKDALNIEIFSFNGVNAEYTTFDHSIKNNIHLEAESLHF